jgi:hypothetical protein
LLTHHAPTLPSLRTEELSFDGGAFDGDDYSARLAHFLSQLPQLTELGLEAPVVLEQFRPDALMAAPMHIRRLRLGPLPPTQWLLLLTNEPLAAQLEFLCLSHVSPVEVFSVDWSACFRALHQLQQLHLRAISCISIMLESVSSSGCRLQRLTIELGALRDSGDCSVAAHNSTLPDVAELEQLMQAQEQLRELRLVLSPRSAADLSMYAHWDWLHSEYSTLQQKDARVRVSVVENS